MEKGSSSSSSDSLNGLSFGKKIYFEGVGSELREDGLPAARSPAKRGRNGAAQGGQPPRCQVEGCKVDLSESKAYYCRHKVCGVHSKSPKVIVAGIEQRFCQQCSRFHQLPEFDQGKRSCRRRLAGHNERRRKPPPGPTLSSHYGSLPPSNFDNRSGTGGLVMDFSGYQTFRGSSSWPNETEPGKYQLSWQSDSPNPQLDSTTLPGYCGSGGIGADAGAGVSSVDSLLEVSESSSALSLLSNQLWSSTNHFLENNSAGAAAVVQPSTNSSGQFSWGFKVDKTGNSVNEMANNDVGSAQISVPVNDQHGDLGLGQPSSTDYRELEHPRDYDSSTQWSL